MNHVRYVAMYTPSVPHTRKTTTDSDADPPTPRPLSDALTSIEEAVHTLGHVEFFCDYDGVLATIAPRPQDACLDEQTQDILMQLSILDACHLSIVSGRALEDVRTRTGIQSITYVGNHGLEIDGPGVRRTHPIPEKTLETLRTLATELQSAMQAYPGVIVEDKQFVIAVHFRLAHDRMPQILDCFSALVTRHNADDLVKVTSGKEVIEVRPTIVWDKGQAVRWLLEERHGMDWQEKVLPIYLGDDKTDEDVFRMLQGKGITVRVGEEASETTTARYTLRNPTEVCEFLAWLRHTLR